MNQKGKLCDKQRENIHKTDEKTNLIERTNISSVKVINVLNMQQLRIPKKNINNVNIKLRSMHLYGNIWL